MTEPREKKGVVDHALFLSSISGESTCIDLHTTRELVVERASAYTFPKCEIIHRKKKEEMSHESSPTK